MSYYDNQQWQSGGQPSWDQQTPPARSGMFASRTDVRRVSIDGFAGASSAVPREDSAAFSTQFEGT
jgi:hypothetical protein